MTPPATRARAPRTARLSSRAPSGNSALARPVGCAASCTPAAFGGGLARTRPRLAPPTMASGGPTPRG
eukprot:3501257-Lingulodinium_polyedra.AAC.1